MKKENKVRCIALGRVQFSGSLLQKNAELFLSQREIDALKKITPCPIKVAPGKDADADADADGVIVDSASISQETFDAAIAQLDTGNEAHFKNSVPDLRALKEVLGEPIKKTLRDELWKAHVAAIADSVS